MDLSNWKIPASVAKHMRGGNPDRDLEPLLRKRFDQIEREFEHLNPFLPGEAPRVLDIGCGLAAMSVRIVRELGADGVDFLGLMDGKGDQELRRVGYSAETRPWFDVKLSLAFARANLPSGVKAVPVEPDPAESWPAADLVVSFKSWGHHYPVSTYLDFVGRSLKPGGLLILDLRKGRSADEALKEAGYHYVAQPWSTEKLDRYVFRRNDG